jgi:hypothetical protein
MNKNRKIKTRHYYLCIGYNIRIQSTHSIETGAGSPLPIDITLFSPKIHYMYHNSNLFGNR